MVQVVLLVLLFQNNTFCENCPFAHRNVCIQPLPFQPGASFGAAPVGALQSPAGLGSGLGSSFYPRRIDIQIRRGNIFMF